MVEAIAVACLLLMIVDFLSTFFYHVPEHIFGSPYLTNHHSGRTNFGHYPILTLNFQVVLDRILGVSPYLLVGVWLWPLSSVGVIWGLLLGHFHL